ncbi:7tm Odorant receptor [Popillia japonica]|uniref:7tm Odorant receptor n=1 Tax=Popillia japonica TaxID=7064 RepID=A0AAW1JHS2_POPJA
MSMVLSLPLFVQYSCGCFIICNAILQLAIVENSNTTNTISILMYTCVNFSQLAAYHWLGNEIMYKSNKVGEACYRSKWYLLDRRSQKCILLLMERAKKPLIIQLYTIVYISLESLTVHGKTTADTLTIVAYTCVTFSQLAAYHWLGNEIMHKSNNVIEACYLSKWYRLDGKSQKGILLLMERAKRPLIIKSYTIIYISLESLAIVSVTTLNYTSLYFKFLDSTMVVFTLCVNKSDV